MFRTFLQAGFECSTHKNRTGRRLDLLEATRHDRFAYQDYCRLQSIRIATIRLAANWSRIEATPGEYNFSSLSPFVNAAEQSGTEILLDLLHFGWPEHIDVFGSTFASSFGRYTRALCRFLSTHRSCCHKIAPVNEISFLSWAGGEVAALNPHAQGRGSELKRNLVRAAVAASEILLNELPGVRLLWPEPVIHIAGRSEIAADRVEAEDYRLAQFEAWDMIAGRREPELGGRPEYLDILGVNFYDRNQWIHQSRTLTREDPEYRPFRSMMAEVWQRYRRPLFVSETGTEGEQRPDWFNYVCDEVIAAHRLEIPVHGICVYPIVNHPGWDDERHCPNGLYDYADENGHREIYWPLAKAILNQQLRLERSYQLTNYVHERRSDLFVPSSVGIRLSTAATLDEPVRAFAESSVSGRANF